MKFYKEKLEWSPTVVFYYYNKLNVIILVGEYIILNLLFTLQYANNNNYSPSGSRIITIHWHRFYIFLTSLTICLTKKRYLVSEKIWYSHSSSRHTTTGILIAFDSALSDCKQLPIAVLNSRVLVNALIAQVIFMINIISIS